MNRSKLKEFFKVWNEGEYIGKLPNGTHLSFARQHISDVEEIEAMLTENLISEWKSLVWLNNIYGQVSLNELQRIALLEFEMGFRKVDDKALAAWYAAAQKEFDEHEM